MVLQANIGNTGGGGGSYITTNGATTGATSQAQVFTSGIKAGVIDDNATSEIIFTISTVQKAAIDTTGINVIDGSAANPSYSFSADRTLGLYNTSTGIGASVGGVLVGGFKTTGLFSTLSAYANNAAALAGSLVVGDFYYTNVAGDGILKVVI